MSADKPLDEEGTEVLPLSQALLLPRIAIEDVVPTVDGGQFAVKAVAGQELVVSAKVFADGHDKLAVLLAWKNLGDADWQRTAMTDKGNNAWQGRLRVGDQGRYVYRIEAWIDQFASFCYELEKKFVAGVPIDLELQEGRAQVLHAIERSQDDVAMGLTALR